MLEDKLLIWKLKHGNKDALSTLYKKYKDRLRTIAGSMLNDPNTAEDVLHDVFVSFAENVCRLRIHTSLKNYLTACVVNRVRDEFRCSKPQTVELDKTEPIVSDSPSPLSRAEADENSHLLIAALSTIPLDQREVIVMHLKGGLKFKEIAKIQNTSVSTVNARYRYGLKKLRTILDEELKK